jgi:ribonuclease P protein subunit POP4
MAVTPETLPRHELVGLPVEVAAASNADAIGITGEVVTETTRTLGIEGEERVWHVPKDGATFAFDLPSGEAVTVTGAVLEERPARRTEQRSDSKWR